MMFSDENVGLSNRHQQRWQRNAFRRRDVCQQQRSFARRDPRWHTAPTPTGFAEIVSPLGTLSRMWLQITAECFKNRVEKVSERGRFSVLYNSVSFNCKKEMSPKRLLLRNKWTSNFLSRSLHAVVGMDVDNKKPKWVHRRTKRMRPPENQQVKGLSAEKVNWFA